MRYNFSLSRYTAWEISMLVLSGKGELRLIHGGVKNNYEHNIVVMNSYELPLCHKLQTMLQSCQLCRYKKGRSALPRNFTGMP